MHIRCYKAFADYACWQESYVLEMARESKCLHCHGSFDHFLILL